MPTSIFGACRGPILTAMVKFGSEQCRIKSACRVASFKAQLRSRFGLRRPRFRPLAGDWTPAGCRRSESYAIAMHGAPALPADFTHMPYANPDAPKGGRLVQGILGTFDSLNPLIVRGLAVQQIRGFVVESLMARGNDEAFTLYGLLAKSVETDDARSYVTFHLDPRARFSDGQPVTRRGRAVFLGLAARQGPSQPSPVLFQSRKGRSARPAHGAVRFRRRRRPRTAADPRPDAGIAQACRRCRDLRGNLDDGADRFRPLSRQRGEARRERDADAQSRLLGPRPAGQPRPVELRRDQARFLSRGQRPVRGVQTRPL